MDEGNEIAGRLLAAARDGDFEAAERQEAELERIDPAALRDDAERLAFWINIYNARVLHEFGERPRKGSLVRHRKLFDRSSYTIGGHEYSLNVIEHGLLRANSRPAYSIRRTLSGGDPRLASAPTRLYPRIHFALNCAAGSCPPVHAYEPDTVEEQLGIVTAAYLQAETAIDRDGPGVKLPYLLKLYRPDFGRTRKDALEFVTERLPGPDGDWLRAEVHGDGVHVSFNDYDWTIA